MGSPERTEALDTPLTWQRRTQPPRCPRRSRLATQEALRGGDAAAGRRLVCIVAIQRASLLGLPARLCHQLGDLTRKTDIELITCGSWHFLTTTGSLCFGVDARVQGRWGWGVGGLGGTHSPHPLSDT